MYTRGDCTRHDEELSGLSRGGSCGRMNKRKVVGQPKKRPNAKARKKETTNKRKIRDQPNTNHGERKSKSLFQKHIRRTREKRDQSV
eukprot:5358049-Pyramimonas_sp.AAC.1